MFLLFIVILGWSWFLYSSGYEEGRRFERKLKNTKSSVPLNLNGTKWKPLLPLTRYEVGDLVKTSDSLSGFNVHKVIRAGITDDLKNFHEWKWAIEMNRPANFHECWDCGEIRFLISHNLEDHEE
jgi:hypothetical protein